MSNGAFIPFAEAVEARCKSLAARGELFRTDVPKQMLWDGYMDAIPTELNQIFRVNRAHDCSCCRGFLNSIANTVSFDDEGNILTIWQDLDLPADSPYVGVAAAMDELVRMGNVNRVFRVRLRTGVDVDPATYGERPPSSAATNFVRWFHSQNTEYLDEGGSIDWSHFWWKVPSRFFSDNVGAVTGELNVSRNMLRDGLETMTVPALQRTLALIEGGDLERGDQFKPTVEVFLRIKQRYDAMEGPAKFAFCWQNLGINVARFKGRLIGTLVMALSDGETPEARAVAAYNRAADPRNYQRSTASISSNQVTSALDELRALGLEPALKRRFATISDMNVRDVLFVDNDSREHMKDPLADLLADEVKPRTRKLKVADGAVIPAQEFFEEVVPGADRIELQVSKEHLGHFVSLTAPAHDDVQPLFSWDNNFSWSYDGNVKDSIKERVKRAGGNVVGLLRVSLGWHNSDDLDLHCMDAAGNHIHFSDMGDLLRLYGYKVLDVDMNAGGHRDDVAPVENLAWRSLPADGEYKVWVNQYNKRGMPRGGFNIEWAYGTDIRQFRYPNAVSHKDSVEVCTFTVRRGEVVGVAWNKQLQPGATSSEKWGVKVGELVPVETIMLSPNYWSTGGGSGQLHRIFILRGCKNPTKARGFYIEDLRSDLRPHRKVLERLADKMLTPESDHQLSGLGFSTSRPSKATFLVRKGESSRTFQVQF